MKRKKYDPEIYDLNLHNILIQTTNLSLYEQVTKKDIIQVLRVRKLPRSFFELKMNRIKTIEPIVCKWLENAHFEQIEIHSVRKIEDSALTYLAKSKSMLELGLTSLNEKQAKILVKYHRAALVFINLKKISFPVAHILSNYQGNILDFPAITSVEPEVFKQLSAYKGDFLTIGALKQKANYNN